MFLNAVLFLLWILSCFLNLLPALAKNTDKLYKLAPAYALSPRSGIWRSIRLSVTLDKIKSLSRCHATSFPWDCMLEKLIGNLYIFLESLNIQSREICSTEALHSGFSKLFYESMLDRPCLMSGLSVPFKRPNYLFI